MNWTPVAERNPPKMGLYIVTKLLRDGSVEVTNDWYFPEPTLGNWQGWNCDWPAVTVAWMEKPKGYVPNDTERHGAWGQWPKP